MVSSSGNPLQSENIKILKKTKLKLHLHNFQCQHVKQKNQKVVLKCFENADITASMLYISCLVLYYECLAGDPELSLAC